MPAQPEPSRHLSRLRIATVLAALLALVYAAAGFLPLHHDLFAGRSLSASDAAAVPLSGSGFAVNTVFPPTRPPLLRNPPELYGSWLQSDASQGEAFSRWYSGSDPFSLLIAGYPNSTDELLSLEVETRDNRQLVLRIDPSIQPGEKWTPVDFKPDRTWARFRIHAIDRSSAPAGWLGFSAPTSIAVNPYELILQLALLLCSVAASLVLVLGPGLLLRYSRVSRLYRSTLLLPVPGLLLSSILGFVLWRLTRAPITHALASLVLVTIGGAILIRFRRPLPPLVITRPESRLLLATCLLITIAVGKATYSVSAVGELYAGEVSRSLEVGARSDSRINYHLVQMVAFHDHAYGPLISALLAPWSFSHRGPLAGLAAASLVLAGPAEVPKSIDSLPWQIFDPQGFAAYRVVMIVIASCFLIPVYGLARIFLAAHSAFLVYLVVAGSPFVLHELYFTWPKILTAGLIVVALGLAFRQRPLLSGAAAGFAYLAHPSALLSVPILLAAPLLLYSAGKYRFLSAAKAWPRQIGGLLLFLLFWRLVNGRHYVQDGFLNYLSMASGLPPTIQNWMLVRWQSLLNTLVPLHLFLFDPNNYAIALPGTLRPITTFFLQCWTSLPSGVGLLLFLPFLRWLFLGCRRVPLATVTLCGIPFLAFLIYWGSFTSGLLREGLHSWFLVTVAFAAFCWLRFGARSQVWWRITSVALLFRSLECLALLLLPPVVTQRQWIGSHWAFSDVASLSVMIPGTLALGLWSYRCSERIRLGTFIRVSEYYNPVILEERPKLMQN